MFSINTIYFTKYIWASVHALVQGFHADKKMMIASHEGNFGSGILYSGVTCMDMDISLSLFLCVCVCIYISVCWKNIFRFMIRCTYTFVYLYYWVFIRTHTYTLRSSSPLRKNVKKRKHQLKIRVLHLVGRSKMKEHLLFKVKGEWRIMLVGGGGIFMHYILWHIRNRRPENIRKES